MPAIAPSSTDPTSIAPPRVPAAEYDSDYFLHSCIGADEWRESHGRSFAGIYPGALNRAGLKRGERVLDLGTGRGELLCAALDLGASEATGVDYAPAAIELARETLAKAGKPEGGRAVLADARKVPVESGRYDLVTMLDVVEHLTQDELTLSLSEAHRALRPGGRTFIHTAPNATVYELTYRIQRRIVPGRARRWPTDPRNDFEHRLHVNEQTRGSLRRSLRNAGFEAVEIELGGWIYTDFVPEPRARKLYRRLARIPLARRLAIFDLFALARKPA